MLAKRLILNNLLKTNSPVKVIQAACHGHALGGFHDERLPIGKREWVGYGINGQPNYQDRPDFPMPAVRFKEITGELVALREKEKGDWKKLTIEEKKKLYRASFRQTLAEVEAPTGELKSLFGYTLILVSCGFLLYIIERLFIYRPGPHTLSEEHRAAMLRKAIDLRMGYLSGASSKWDYEKDDFKK